jgi:hypothetical protein
MFNINTESGNFKTASLAVILAVAFFFGNSLQTIQAQPAPTPSGAPEPAGLEGASSEEINEVCQIEMEEFFWDEFGNYMDFMDTHFQNKNSTVSLLDTAVSRYREFRDTAMNKYFTYFPQQGALQLTEGIEKGACLQIVEEALYDAREVLKMKANSTSAVKKTTALITKYQQINEKLRLLNQTFLDMKRYLDVFADKLPCYIVKACNKA